MHDRKPLPNVESRIVTEDELRAAKKRILAEHPYLETFGRSCCMGCAEGEAETRWGVAAKLAFIELDSVRFLLGEDPRP